MSMNLLLVFDSSLFLLDWRTSSYEYSMLASIFLIYLKSSFYYFRVYSILFDLDWLTFPRVCTSTFDDALFVLLFFSLFYMIFMNLFILLMMSSQFLGTFTYNTAISFLISCVSSSILKYFTLKVLYCFITVSSVANYPSNSSSNSYNTPENARLLLLFLTILLLFFNISS